MKAKIRLVGERAREGIASLLPLARHLEPMLELDDIDITIEKHKRRRTSPQNRRYWAILTALGDHTGLTKEEMHEEVLCEKFDYDLVEWRGSVVKRPKVRSSRLDTQAFNELMFIAERWAVEEGVMFEEHAA